MPVFRGSRYAGVKFTGVLGADGKVRKFLHARDRVLSRDVSGPIITHEIQRMEQLDGLAFQVSGQAQMWWLIADVSDVFFPLDLDPGTEVSIPIEELRSRARKL